MRIIPAIDIIDGKCVRLSKGDYEQKTVYNDNPVEVAKQFEAHGIEYLHVVDLDGAKSKQIVNYKVLEQICNQTNLKVDFGGGLKSTEDVDIAFSIGASQITGGSIAVHNPDLFESWIERFGAEHIILGADCLNRKIATHGWMNVGNWDVLSFLKHYQDKGILSTICTDIAKDGMLEGCSIDLYEEIIRETSVGLIASGGVCSVRDVHLLKKIGCEGVIIGKALYEGKITLKELEDLC